MVKVDLRVIEMTSYFRRSPERNKDAVSCHTQDTPFWQGRQELQSAYFKPRLAVYFLLEWLGQYNIMIFSLFISLPNLNKCNK